MHITLELKDARDYLYRLFSQHVNEKCAARMNIVTPSV